MLKHIARPTQRPIGWLSCLLKVVAITSFVGLLGYYPVYAQEVTPTEVPAPEPSNPTTFKVPPSFFDPDAKPQREQLEEIKRQVGINIFEGTDLDTEKPKKGVKSNQNKELQAEQPPASMSRRKKALREAAYELDKTAHQLELDELFQEADYVREMATEFRQSARQLVESARARRLD